ncbi:hypothetical protein F4W66_24625 (plasmid) [Escherichia coli]|nr:hypothetical protein F4W66_24625 [Escherichia coli]
MMKISVTIRALFCLYLAAQDIRVNDGDTLLDGVKNVRPIASITFSGNQIGEDGSILKQIRLLVCVAVKILDPPPLPISRRSGRLLLQSVNAPAPKAIVTPLQRSRIVTTWKLGVSEVCRKHGSQPN